MRTALSALVVATSFSSSAQTPSRWWWFYEDSVQHFAYAGGDEFSGRALDRDFWMTSFDGRRNHHGTHMLEYNTDGNNLTVRDGLLTISLRRDSVTARGVEYDADEASLGDGGPNRRTWRYTSSLLTSRGAYQYGIFEARIKLPTGKGAWPSFWLFGGQPNEEIDILEGKGEKPDKFHVDVHCPGDPCDNYRNPIGGVGRWLGINWKGFGHWRRVDGDLTASFNDYVGEWTPEVMRFYLNEEQCAEWEGGLHVPERIVLQNALANTCKGCPFGPGPDDTTTFGDMLVDHVRIWKNVPAEELLAVDGGAKDRSQSAVVRFEAATETLQPRGGKRGKVRKAMRVKTIMDRAARTLTIEVEGDLTEQAFLEVLDPQSGTFVPRRALQRGVFTITFAPGVDVTDLRVGDGQRNAVERVNW